MALFSRREVLAASMAASIGRVVTRWQYDEASDATIVKRIQDVEPILEHNKALQTLNDGYSRSRDIRRVASIPTVVVEQWMREGVNIFDRNCDAEIRRRLNDPTNLFLRTAPGRL